MRALVATWDGGGNLPPIAALIEGLVDRGHDAIVIGHDSQRARIVTLGATFLRYATAPQWDVGVPGWLGEDPAGAFALLNETAGEDIAAVAARAAPDVALIDCMLPKALTRTRSAGFKTVALVHAAYSFFEGYGGGFCKGPIDAADLALGMSYPAFDRGAVFPANLAFVGPLRPDIGVTMRPRAAPGKPLVLASLSTGYQTPGQMALLQRVCDALKDLDVEAVVTTGRGIAPAALSIGRNTAAVRSVPHDAVLPAADLLVTHAGHGTVMAGLRYGVPMLCLPAAADQPFNAGKVAAIGVGIALSVTSSVEEIRASMSRLLADPELRRRAQALAAEVGEDRGAARAVELLEALAA